MEPRPFYKNEFIKFDDDNDPSEYGKALRMFDAWKEEHGDKATAGCLKRALTAAGFHYIAEGLGKRSSSSAGGA